MLDLKRLKVLREVAKHGSFSAAAETLYVSQSAVSQQIAALEREVGVPLLIRLRSGPELTDAGVLLVRHADSAIARLECAERELTELAGLETGELRLSSFPSASASLLIAAATVFHGLHPKIRLSIAEGDPEDSLPELRRGEHDIALVYDFEANPLGPDPEIELHPLVTERMHAALPRNHPLAGRSTLRLEELGEERWMCGTCNGSCRDLTLLSCQAAGFEADVAYESDDYNVMLGMISAGLGVTLIPDLALVNPLVDRVAVVPIDPDPPIRRVWAATPVAGTRSRATAAMLSILDEVSADFVPPGIPGALAAG